MHRKKDTEDIEKQTDKTKTVLRHNCT